MEMLVVHCNYSHSGLIYDDMFFRRENVPIIESFILNFCTKSDSSETMHFWLFAANFSTLDFFEKLTNRVEKKLELAKLFYAKLFQFENEKNRNIFYYAAKNDEQKCLDRAENKLVDFLNEKSVSYKSDLSQLE